MHTSLRVRGWGSPNSDDWRKSKALCMPTLCPCPPPRNRPTGFDVVLFSSNSPLHTTVSRLVHVFATFSLSSSFFSLCRWRAFANNPKKRSTFQHFLDQISKIKSFKFFLIKKYINTFKSFVLLHILPTSLGQQILKFRICMVEGVGANVCPQILA